MSNSFHARISSISKFNSIIYSLLLVLPPIFLLIYVNEFGVNLIFWDEWAMVPLIQKEMSGTLAVTDLFAQHNEHRIPFARMVMLYMGKFTQYNTITEMIFSWIILCFTGLLIFSMYWVKFCDTSRNRRLLYFIPVSFLLFSFRQYESILMGFTCHIYLMIFGIVGTIFLLDTSKKIDVQFILSFFCAILASFSFIIGLLIWPVGFLQLLLSKRRIDMRKVALWCFLSGLVVILYFWGYVKPGGHPSLSYILENPVLTGRFFLTLIGAPLSHEHITATSFGLIIMFLAIFIIVYAYKGKLLRTYNVWFSLIFFVTMSSIATTLGRAGFGVDQALPSRYTPVTILGIIALYLLALAFSQKIPNNNRNFGAHAMLTLILAGLIVSYGVGWYAGNYTHNSREIGAYVLSTHKIQSDENIRKYLFPNPAYVGKYAPFLEQNRLNVFSKENLDTSKLSLKQSNTLSSIDFINSELVSPDLPPVVVNSSVQKTINITGWAIDKESNDLASAVFIVFNNELVIPTHYGVDRPDVSQQFNSKFRFSGFVATFSSSTLEKGEMTFFMIIVGSDEESYYRTDEEFIFISD